MKKVVILSLLMTLSAALVAGTDAADFVAKRQQQAVTLSAQWNHAFHTIRQNHDLTPEQNWLVDRALELGTVDQFDQKAGEADWIQAQGAVLADLMTEARTLLPGNTYVELLLAMGNGQFKLLELAVIPAGACNCNGLCDCDDVAPMYSRCQSAPCLRPFPTPPGYPVKICQYQ